jgi:hypothetical protein
MDDMSIVMEMNYLTVDGSEDPDDVAVLLNRKEVVIFDQTIFSFNEDSFIDGIVEGDAEVRFSNTEKGVFIQFVARSDEDVYESENMEYNSFVKSLSNETHNGFVCEKCGKFLFKAKRSLGTESVVVNGSMRVVKVVDDENDEEEEDEETPPVLIGPFVCMNCGNTYDNIY